MNRMQYGEFVFPHNPRRIELSYTGALAPQVFPGCGAAVQELGPRCRVARCEGEVFAYTAQGDGRVLTYTLEFVERAAQRGVGAWPN